ncbi:MAG: pitrilysin family protein [Alphaproteobacteria bacterium]
MTVVVLPNDRTPEVAHILFVKAGAADDPYGKSGLAHYVEHLMFTGTPDFPEGAYDHLVTRSGGEQNAFTTRDFTGFYVVIAKERLEDVMKIESDRLQHLTLDPARSAREHKVITAERDTRVENSAESLLAEQLDAITYLNHPYHQPVIGWAEDMAGLNVDDARAYYKAHYVPSNLVLVVAGDVTPKEVERLAGKYYGALPSREAPKRDWPQNPPIRLALHASMTDEKAGAPRLVRQYLARASSPGRRKRRCRWRCSPRYSAATNRACCINRSWSTRSSPPISRSITTRCCSGLRCCASRPCRRPACRWRRWRPRSIRRWRRRSPQPPSADDTQRAKTQLKAELVFASDGLEPLAQLIGTLYMLGRDEEFFYRWGEEADKVTPQAMLEAGRDVLNPAHAVTGTLKPLHPGAGVAPAKLDMGDSNVR